MLEKLKFLKNHVEEFIDEHEDDSDFPHTQIEDILTSIESAKEFIINPIKDSSPSTNSEYETERHNWEQI